MLHWILSIFLNLNEQTFCVNSLNCQCASYAAEYINQNKTFLVLSLNVRAVGLYIFAPGLLYNFYEE